MTVDIGKHDTFPKLLMHHARARGALPAIREKDLGIWQTWTWHELAEEVRALACALADRGLKRGDHMALIGDNRPRIYAAMCAAQCLGAIPVPLYQDAIAAEMAFPIQNAEIAFAFAVTPKLLVSAVIWASVIGLIGGLFPAVRAARLPVAAALRET